MKTRYRAFTRKKPEGDINRDALLIGERVIQADEWTGQGTLQADGIVVGVADGISSQPASGQVARFLLGEVTGSGMPDRVMLEELNRRAFERFEGAGSTLSLLVLNDGFFNVLHAGNSMVYRKWGDNVVPITPAQEVMGGLYNAFGIREGIEVYTLRLRLEPGDAFVLRSDGIPFDDSRLFDMDGLLARVYNDDATWVEIEVTDE